MGWDAGQEVVADATAVGQDDLVAAGFEALDPASGMEADPLRFEQADDRRAHHGARNRHWRGLRAVDLDLAPFPQTPAAHLVVEKQSRLVGGGWALVRQSR